MELAGLNVVVFDLEIKNVIDGGQITWNDHNKMGISVGCLHDYYDGDQKVYMDDNLPELARRLIGADLVVGFNILGFDLPLLKATLKVRLDEHVNANRNLYEHGFAGEAADLLDLIQRLDHVYHYDLLYWSRRATGWNDGQFFPKGLKLDDHLLGTFGQGFMKTEHGANAPLLWQAGKLGQLISYCLADVKRERLLFEHVFEGKPVKTAAHGERTLHSPRSFLIEVTRTVAVEGGVDVAAGEVAQ